MSDPNVKKQVVYLAQAETPYWRKYSWNAFSLMLGGIPSVYMFHRTQEDQVKERARQEKERAEERARQEKERAEERARQEKERADWDAIVKANAAVQHHNETRWFWQPVARPVSTGEEARQLLAGK